VDSEQDQSALWSIVQADGDKAYPTASGAVPVQFCSIGDSASLFQCALHRALSVTDRRHIIATVTARHRRWWSPPLWCLPEKHRIIDQSTGRLTITLAGALALIERSDADARVVVQVPEAFCATGAFTDAVAQALRVLEALPTHIVALTTEPFTTEANQDYLLFGPPDRLPGLSAARFIKRPTPVVADRLVALGAHVSLGIYVARLATLTSLFESVWPNLMAAARSLVERASGEMLTPLHMPGTRFSRPWRHTWVQRPLPRLRAVSVDRCGWVSLGSAMSLASGLSPRRLAGE
jgi:mannose-1-phosphate guanylyltransferase